MNMKYQTGLLIALLVVVSGVVGYVAGMGRTTTPVHQMPDGNVMTDTSMGMHDEMANMMASLEGKEGDELDKAFLAEMIVHHEGAVDMAEAVLARGKHPEVKQLASNIVAAQTMEIAQMKSWLKTWYGE
ncbi:MAG: DUF305 domain-containing protein [Patescibacteria group bacterium]